jgi:hypothetical protein
MSLRLSIRLRWWGWGNSPPVRPGGAGSGWGPPGGGAVRGGPAWGEAS